MLCQTLMMMALPTKSMDERPASVGHVDSTTRPVRCHWEDAAYSDYCDEILEGVELAWTAQVDEQGWPEPILDEDGILDVYVSSEGGTAYAYGPWEDADPDDGRMGTAAHIVIDPDFAAETWIYWTMLHEFSHVLQYSIDFTEPRYVAWEGAATATEYWSSEILNFPEGDPLWPLDDYIRDFQSQPWVGLLGDGWQIEEDYDISSLYEYGAALWLFYLDHRTADGARTAGRDLWLNSAQDSLENEPDFVDAMGLAFEDWTEGWLEFAIMRISVGTGTRTTPAWAAPYSDAEFGVRIEDTIAYSELPVTVIPKYQPSQTGAVYWAVTDVPDGERIRASVDGDPSVNWAVIGYENGYGSWKESEMLERKTDGGDIIIGAVNLGSSGFDADEIIEPADVSVDIWMSGAAADEGGEKGGGCATASRLGSGWIWLSGLLLLGWRRQR